MIVIRVILFFLVGIVSCFIGLILYEVCLFKIKEVFRQEEMSCGSFQEFALKSSYNPKVQSVCLKTGEVFIVKQGRDQSVMAKWISMGLLAHEYAMLQRAKQVPGVVKLIGKVSSNAFCVEYIPFMKRGYIDLAQAASMKIKLMESLDCLHKLCLYHLDFAHRNNILIRKDYEPILIDFGSAIQLPSIVNWALGPLFAYKDRMDVFKWLFSINSEVLTEEEMKELFFYKNLMTRLRFRKTGALLEAIRIRHDEITSKKV